MAPARALLLAVLAALTLAAARPRAMRAQRAQSALSRQAPTQELPASRPPPLAKPLRPATPVSRHLRPAATPPALLVDEVGVPELQVFKMLSYAGLAGAVNVNDVFGAEDKLTVCYNRTTIRTAPLLVYPDLDNLNGTLFVSADVGASWDTLPIVSNACPDPNQPPAPVAPRNSGYTVGMTVDNSTGYDRILILGGDGDQTNNVYYSDDCGITWDCFDGEQEWDPRGACERASERAAEVPASPRGDSRGRPQDCRGRATADAGERSALAGWTEAARTRRSVVGPRGGARDSGLRVWSSKGDCRRSSISLPSGSGRAIRASTSLPAPTP